jgi:hypothetical protein
MGGAACQEACVQQVEIGMYSQSISGCPEDVGGLVVPVLQSIFSEQVALDRLPGWWVVRVDMWTLVAQSGSFVSTPIWRQPNKVRTWNLRCNEVTAPYGIICKTIPFGWSWTRSYGIPLSHPLEQECKCGGSWNPHLRDWQLAHPQQKGVRNGNLDYNAHPSHIVHQPRHRILWTSKMTATTTMKRPFLNPKNVLMQRWKKAIRRSILMQGWKKVMAFSTLLSSPYMCKENLTQPLPTKVLVLNGKERTRHKTQHERHVLRLARLPIPFEWRPSRLAAPHQRG